MRSLSKRPLGAIFLCAFGALSHAQTAPVTDRAGGAEGPGLIARSWASANDMDAWRGTGVWRASIAPWAPHFRKSEEHRRVWAIAIERQRPDDWMAGFSYFSNSFGQPSAYAYVGKRFNRLWNVEPLFFQASAGVIYGYKGKYKDKVALNVGGFAPGALVGLGWKFDERSSATLHLLGDAGVMLQLSYDLK
jgi:hypothetical protein